MRILFRGMKIVFYFSKIISFSSSFVCLWENQYLCTLNHHPKGEGYGERLVLPIAMPEVAYLTYEVGFSILIGKGLLTSFSAYFRS